MNLSLIYNIPQLITSDNIIEKLSQYEMTRENYCLKTIDDNPKTEEKSNSIILSTPPIIPPPPPQLKNLVKSPPPPIYSDFTPIDCSNSLFWCLYISKIGLSEFEILPPNKHKNIEMEQKQNTIKFINTPMKWNKKINHKITNIKFKELMTDLLLNKEVDVYSMFLLVLYYDLHIYLVNSEETVYTEYIPNTEKYISGEVYENTIILRRQHSGKYSVDYRASVDKIGKIKLLYKIDQIFKPVNGVSTYKTQELTDILNKFGIYMKCKKADMFIEYKKYIETKTFFIV